MAVIDFVHNGVRYISDSEGYFRYKNCNYLKFKLDKTIAESLELPTNIEYYVNKCSPTTYEIELSLSQQPDTDVIISIEGNQTFFENSIRMPKAKIRFHPNGGEATNAIVTNTYVPYEEQEATLNNLTKCSNATIDWDRRIWKPSELFTKVGYQSIHGWNLQHPTIENKFLPIVEQSCVSSRLTDDVHSDAGEALLKEYAPIYPNTYYYLYATWTKADSFNIIYHDEAEIYTESGISYNTLYRNKIQYGGKWNGSERVFIGWDEDPAAINPKYYLNSDFILTKLEDVHLYAIYSGKNVSDSKKINVLYDPDGGWYGVRFAIQELSSQKFTLLPTGDPPNSTSWPRDRIPCRPGYRFLSWSAGNPGTKFSGDGGTSIRLVAKWEKIPSNQVFTTDTTDWSLSILNQNFNGYSEVCKFNAKPNDRYVSFSFNDYGGVSSTKRTVCARIFDENGETVSGSILWWEANLWNSDGVGVNKIILRKNKTYYLEVASENVEDSSSRTYGLSISESADFMNTGIISPNGGLIMRPNSFSYTSEDLNKSFNSRGYFAISTNSNNSSTDNPGLPFYSFLPNNLESGYWFDRWIGTKTWYSIYYQDSYSQWEISRPGEDVSVSALWNPNLFYIKYNGNGNDVNSVMPNTAHEYNNDFTIGLNSYMKTTKIIYRARKGTYSDPKDWAENSNENVTIIRQGTEEREIKLNHTLDGWKYNNATTLPAGYTNSFSQLKTDLGLNNLEDLAFYGDMIELDAQWQTNKVKLPTMYREGFTFLGWFTEEENGERVGDENGYFSSDIKEITLYAHWEPIGLVQIYTGNKWQYAIPYIYNEGSWKRAMQYTYNGSEWKRGTGSGQNMTNKQLENL